jgi:hypothetical protein
MQSLELKIHALGDPPIFPELNDKIAFGGELTHVAILERGMVSGACSLCLYVKITSHPDPADGRYVWVQMGSGMLQMIASALKGANERFNHGLSNEPAKP